VVEKRNPAVDQISQLSDQNSILFRQLREFRDTLGQKDREIEILRKELSEIRLLPMLSGISGLLNNRMLENPEIGEILQRIVLRQLTNLESLFQE